MTHFLDELPLDFTNAGIQDLLHTLTDAYYTTAKIVPLVRNAGIPLATIDLDGPAVEVWPDVLITARNQGRLRTLLEKIAQSPDSDVAGRISELISASPIVGAPVPADGIAWTIDPADADGLERQLESQPTLLDVSFLERGVELAPSVARLLVTLGDGDYHGTAFRIGDDLLLTNHHVLFDKAGPAKKVVAWFGYERSFSGADRAHVEVVCRPETIVGAADHDWAVVRVASPMPTKAEIIPLTGGPPPAPLDRVYIIQHPNGGVKKIGMIHNVVVGVTDDLVQYRTDTEGGSSGSPVFDEDWQLVALHHQWGSKVVGGRREYYNQGRRIERVVEGLTAKGVL
ncbi:MAG: trypsin-like peptidase domain-containing protein [Dermatophilaceae bacterium]